MFGDPKEFLLLQIAHGVRRAPPDSIADWLAGDLSIIDMLFEPNKEILRRMKAQAMEILDTVSGADIREACLSGAPHLADLWYSPLATSRFEGEVAIMRHYVRGL